MNWFRELLVRFTQLFGDKPKRRWIKIPQHRESHEMAPQKMTRAEDKAYEKTSQMPKKTLDYKAEQKVQSEVRITEGEYLPELENEPVVEQHASMKEKKPEQASENASTMETLQSVMQPNNEDTVEKLELVLESGDISPVEPLTSQMEEMQLSLDISRVAPLPPVVHLENEKLSQQSAPLQDGVDPTEKEPIEVHISDIKEAIEESENVNMAEAVIQPSELPAIGDECVLPAVDAPLANDVVNTDVQKQWELAKKEQLATAEKPDTVQRVTVEELELSAPRGFQWQKEQHNEFTLQSCQKESETENGRSKEMIRLRFVQKESLVLPPSDDEMAWIKNAIQATDLILSPFHNQKGDTKTFVSNGMVITVWETTVKSADATWFAVSILTHQAAYILVGRKSKQISAKDLSAYFVVGGSNSSPIAET